MNFYSKIKDIQKYLSKEKKNSCIAIIPARGGSKSIKGKNIKLLNNKPLIAYSIEIANSSEKIQETIVTSDSHEILQISKKYEAETILRPCELANDIIHPEPSIVHALLNFLENKGFLPQCTLMLQPTSPLRTSKHIDDAINKYLRGKYDSLISISYSFKKHKFSVGIKKNYLIREKNKFNNKYLFINGAIYISSIKKFLKNKSFFSRKTGFFLMPKKYSLDVDTKKDIQSLKKLFKNDKKIT